LVTEGAAGAAERPREHGGKLYEFVGTSVGHGRGHERSPPRFCYCYWVSRTYLGYRQRDEGPVAVDENLIAFWYRAPWLGCSRLYRHRRRVEAAAKTDYGDLGSGRPGTGAPTHSDFLSSINPMLSGTGLKKRSMLWYMDDTSWRCLSGATDCPATTGDSHRGQARGVLQLSSQCVVAQFGGNTRPGETRK
jgi:hypothetical protein